MTELIHPPSIAFTSRPAAQRRRSADVIVLLGSSGFAGRMHSAIYEAEGWTVVGVDPVAGDPALPTLHLGDAIVDICTPTALHASSIRELYALGARRFIVEKPQTHTGAEWAEIVNSAPDATILSVHNYLWSDAFHRAVDALGPLATLETHFDKNRQRDDWNGRGAHAGELAHILQVEAPHQFAMATWLDPSLTVTRADTSGNRYPNTDRTTPSCATVDLVGAQISATIGTNLRSPIRRSMRLTDTDGRVARITFAPGGLQDARLTVIAANSTKIMDWAGSDDALGRNLRGAVDAFDDNAIDPRLSCELSSRVLEMVDAAIASSTSNHASVSARVPKLSQEVA